MKKPAIPHKRDGVIYIPSGWLIHNKNLSAGARGLAVQIACWGGSASRGDLEMDTPDAPEVISAYVEELWRAGYLASCGDVIELRRPEV